MVWEIGVEIGADEEAALAAQQVWTEVFGRGLEQPTAEEACVFSVHEPDGRVLETDLSHESCGTPSGQVCGDLPDELRLVDRVRVRPPTHQPGLVRVVGEGGRTHAPLVIKGTPHR